MRRVVYLCLIVIFIACAHDNSQIITQDDNVNIIVQLPDDSLIDQIDSYSLTVTADDIVTSVYATSSISLSSGIIQTLTACIPAGDERILTIYFSDSEGSIIFWGKGQADVLEDEAVSVDISVVQAAAQSATRIKILRDSLPWDSEALDDVLSDIGLTLGTEDDQYEVISSDDFSTVNLSAGEDLVIIANDQSQEFYNNYSTSQAKIDAFVAEGGTILWEACDLGWARGSIDSAGLDLPGGVESISGYESTNYITGSLYNVTSGMDSVLTGNYASHEGFINLPDGTLVYTRDTRGLPTLISFKNGIGWVIITGQPLEYDYQPDDNSIPGALLPRIIRHVLGYDI